MSFFRKSNQLQDTYSRSERSSTLLTSSMSSFISQSGQPRRLIVKQNLSLPQVQLLSKQDYKKQKQCTVCNIPFSTTFRQHHCRICANAVCFKCSYGTINKERACDICYLRWLDPSREERKEKLISCLETLCTNISALKDEKKKKLVELRGCRIDPEEILKVNEKELAKYEEMGADVRKRKAEAEQRVGEKRKEIEELKRMIAELE